MIYIFKTDGKFVEKVFTSAEASEFTGIYESTVSKIVNGEMHQSCNYTFVKPMRPIGSKEINHMSKLIQSFFSVHKFVFAHFMYSHGF